MKTKLILKNISPFFTAIIKTYFPILTTILILISFGHKGFAQNQIAKKIEPNLSAPYLYNFEQLSRLSDNAKVEVFKVLRNFAIQVEEQQTNRGSYYGKTASYNYLLNWTRFIETAEAQTQQKKGAPCIFGGNFTTYYQDSAKACGENFMRDLACSLNSSGSGRPWGVKCNPVLFGTLADNKPFCVQAAGGATKLCDAARIQAKINDKQLIEKIRSNSKLLGDYKALQDNFNNFCTKVILSGDRDPNFEACRMVSRRLQEIGKAENPPPPSAVAPPAPSAVIQLRVTLDQDVCRADAKKVIGCFKCEPENKTQKASIKLEDIKSTRYGELISVVEASCNIENKDDKDSVKPMNAENLIKKLGVCAADIYNSTETDKAGHEKDKEQLKKLLELNENELKSLNSGAWGWNRTTKAFESYFGVELKTARAIFCGNGLSALPGEWTPPSHLSSELDTNPLNIQDLMKTTGSPSWGLNGGGAALSQADADGARRAINMRNKLRSCLTQQANIPEANRGVGEVQRTAAQKCNLYKTNWTGKNLQDPQLTANLQWHLKSGKACLNSNINCDSEASCKDLIKFDSKGETALEFTSLACGTTITEMEKGTSRSGGGISRESKQAK